MNYFLLATLRIDDPQAAVTEDSAAVDNHIFLAAIACDHNASPVSGPRWRVVVSEVICESAFVRAIPVHHVKLHVAIAFCRIDVHRLQIGDLLPIS